MQGFYLKLGCALFRHDRVPVMVDNAMGRLGWRRTPHPAAVGSPAWRGRTAYGALALAMAGGLLHYIPGPPRGETAAGTIQTTAAFHRIILPDLAVIQGSGISDASLARIAAIRGISQTMALDGAKVTSGGVKVNVIGVNAQRFRSWTPLRTASNQRLWTALDAGGFVATPTVRRLWRPATSRPAGPRLTSSCSRSPRRSSARGCRGRCSRPSARSRAATAPTPECPARVPSARCSSCRPP